MLGGGLVHAVAAAEATDCSAKVPNLASKCTGSCPSTLCCALACAGLEVDHEDRRLAREKVFDRGRALLLLCWAGMVP